MGTTTSTHVVKVTDGGTLQTTTGKAEKLNSTLTQTEKLGKAAKAALAKTDQQGYDQARASVGTGAAGRDFANQAQGLGGLVRVYATFAANLFAVSAAYNALSRAADTSNLVKGLDQLGAASGRNLGTLAKDIVKATDSAVSLREAMTATAQASAAGMSNKDILRMAEGAKKASQALGVDMADALSRISRGITKLEPELLDEIGIFVRVDKAAQDYAKSIGKPVSALTDLEKRSAFAAAALTQVESKFGAINIDSNPYTKLLAQLKNVATAGLDLVNKVLGPLVNMLAQSPAALSAVLLGIGTILLKQAIPAIGMWREELKSSALEAERTATRINSAFTDYDVARKMGPAQALSDAATAEANMAISKVQTALGKAFSSNSKLVKSAMSSSYDPDANQGNIDRQAKAAATKLRNLEEARKITNNTDAAHLLALDQAIAKQKQQLALVKQASIENIIASQKMADSRNILDKAEQSVSINTPEGWAREKIAKRASAKAQSMGILSNVGTNTQVMGMSEAFRELFDEVNNGGKKFDESGKLIERHTDKLKGVSRASTLVKGSFSILTSTLGTMLNAFSTWIMVIGLAVAGYELLNSWLSDNSKEVEKFNSSIEELTASTKVATDTAKLYGETLSISSVLAKSAAFSTLSDSVDTLVSSLEKADVSASRFDRFIDGIKSVVGEDLKSDFSSSISSAVSSGLAAISDPKLKKDAESRLKELLNIKDLAASSVKSSMDNTDIKDIVNVGRDISSIFKDISKQGKLISEPLDTLKAGFKDTNDRYNELANSFNNTTPLSKLGSSVIQQSANLAEAFKQPISTVVVLKDIMEDMSQIKMFPPQTQAEIVAAGLNVQNITKDLDKAQLAANTAEKNIRNAVLALTDPELSKEERNIYITAKMVWESDLKTATSKIDIANSKLQVVQRDLGTTMGKSIQDSFKLIEAPLVNAIAKGSIEVQKALVDKLPKTAATAAYSAKLDQQSIGLQIKQVTATYDLVKALDLARLSNERLTLEKQRDELNPTTQAGFDKLSELNKQITNIRQTERSYKSNDLSKDVKSGLIDRDAGVNKLLEQEVALKTQIAALKSAAASEKIKGAVSIVEAGFIESSKNLQQALDSVKAEKSELIESPEYRSAAVDQQNKLLDALNEKERTYQKSLSLLEPLKSEAVARTIADNAPTSAKGTKGIKELAVTASEDARAARDLQETNIDKNNTSTRAAELRKRNLDAMISGNALLNAQDTARLAIETKRIDLEEFGINAQLANLEIQNSRGRLDTDEYTRTKASLDLRLLDLSTSKQLFSAEIAHKEKIRSIEQAKEGANSAEESARASQELANEKSAYDLLVQSIKLGTAAKKQDINSTLEQTAQQKRLEDAINNSASALIDGFFDATQSGKFEFTDMVNSMLMDIARLEFRMSMLNLYNQAGGGKGILNAITSFITQANGGAWNSGVQMFAKGGSFTNQIVDSPTLFKFAKGTGMMGEAGPEAIMPLKRDAQGRLGVSGGNNAPATQVVVNNYSGQQVETQESVDSRGQRKIEVSIGNMVAGEIMRSGSMAQQSIKNTFGQKPQLIRR